jgi:PIN domain nuclease of toxin-antitoxin system
VSAAHAFAVTRLVSEHGDPFDLLPAAQCIIEAPIVSADEAFRPLPVKVVW